jgi:adenylate kinase family enzyme
MTFRDPSRPGRRVLIAGLGGSGKTTLARTLGPALGLPVYELDSMYYGPDLGISPTFEDDVERLLRSGSWLLDSQGPPVDSPAPPRVRARLWECADTLVWLDYPRRVVVARAVRRSVRRILTRQRLWHGHRESPLWWLRADHPIRRAWRLTAVRREELTARTADPQWAHLTVVRLRSPRETAKWLETVLRRSAG